jgi:hypothetical protein
VRAGFVPLMRDLEGFQGYYLLDGGEDVLITVSMFDSADAALASNAKAADWVRHNVLEFACQSARKRDPLSASKKDPVRYDL